MGPFGPLVLILLFFSAMLSLFSPALGGWLFLLVGGFAVYMIVKHVKKQKADSGDPVLPLSQPFLIVVGVYGAATLLYIVAIMPRLGLSGAMAMPPMVVIGIALVAAMFMERRKRVQQAINNLPAHVAYFRNPETGALEQRLMGNPNVRPPAPVVAPSGEHGTAKLGDGSALPSSGFDDDEDASRGPTTDEVQALAARIRAKGWTTQTTPKGLELRKPGPEGGAVIPSSMEELRAIATLIEQGRV